jgi:hypothetical protein
MRPPRPVHISGPFLGTDAVVAGVLTRAQLRGPLVRRLYRGVYLPAAEPLTAEVRVRAATLLLPASAIVTGRSAAVVRGVPLGWRDDPVEVAVPEDDHFGPVRGLHVVRTVVDPSDSEPWEHGHLATPERAAFDLVRWRPLPEAVGDLDSVVRAGTVTVDGVERYLRGRHDHGIVNARAALQLADPRSESPPESALRVYLVLAGLDPVPQHEVVVPGGRTVRVDLAFPGRRLAVEYDGGWHVLREQLERDRWRTAALRAAGWTTVHVTAQMMRNPAAVVRQVHAELAAAAA